MGLHTPQEEKTALMKQRQIQEAKVALIKQRQFQETMEIERKRRSLQEEKRKLAQERRELEREKMEFQFLKKAADRKSEQNQRLFSMKWKLLEDEVKKLASERDQFERDKALERDKASERQNPPSVGKNSSAQLFFVGVDDGDTLRKRYRDLIKIYHPDNISGDTSTLQVINNEYDKLRVIFE